jgi:hypothetical protein
MYCVLLPLYLSSIYQTRRQMIYTPPTHPWLECLHLGNIRVSPAFVNLSRIYQKARSALSTHVGNVMPSRCADNTEATILGVDSSCHAVGPLCGQSTSVEHVQAWCRSPSRQTVSNWQVQSSMSSFTIRYLTEWLSTDTSEVRFTACYLAGASKP